MKKILFFGFGNMGQAIAQGLLQQAGKYEIEAVDPYFYEQGLPVEGVILYKDGLDVQQKYDVVVLAVKPQMAEKVYPLLSHVTRSGGAVLSIMAGVGAKQIAGHVNTDIHVVRSMPNTPAAIGKGVSVLVSPKGCPEDVKETCGRILEAVGEVFWVEDEEQMHAVTAVSGSGPAYFFALMDEMIKAGVFLGLPEELSQALVCGTAEGAGALAKLKSQTNNTPSQLKVAVTSKGGTTEAALGVFYKNQFDKIVGSALKAAEMRSKELSF